MKARAKTIIILVVVVLIVASLSIIRNILSRTKYSPDGLVGNTAGNLYNGGLFCEYDGKIYFSNINDSGSLYSMDSDCTNIKKLCDDRTYYINVDDNYLYYSRRNNERPKEEQSVFTVFNTGLYRVDHNGNSLKKLYGDPVGTVLVYDNNIYYQHYNEKRGLEVYRTNIAGENETAITNELIIPLSVFNNKIYYSGINSDHGIHELDLNTLTSGTVYDGFTYHPIVTEKWIYYIATTDNYNIRRISRDGLDNELVVNEFCSTYNISPDERYLFFQVDGGSSNRICSLDMANGTVEDILTGDFNEINITSQYMFFSAFDGSTMYVYPYNSTKQLSIFNPPKD